MVVRTSAPASPEQGRPSLHDYLIAEDEMGDSVAQTVLLTYLCAVLAHQYRDAGWFIARNLTFYHPAIQNNQNLISPDMAVFVGLSLPRREQQDVTSWEMRPAQAHTKGRPVRPSPTVVFEVTSDGTWKTDIGPGEAHKPWLYGQMGAREYYAYDPNNPPVWRDDHRKRLGRRLLGWRYDEAGLPIAYVPDERGWLWSDALDSWLSPDEELLRLYDRAGVLRLTAEEASAALAESEHRARLEAEQRWRDAEQRRAAVEAELRRLRGASQ